MLNAILADTECGGMTLIAERAYEYCYVKYRTVLQYDNKNG